MCLAPFYPALDKSFKSQPVQNAITTFFSTSCVQHLQHRVPIPSSCVWGHLLEILGLSEVRFQFPKCHGILPLCSWVSGTRNCVSKDIHHIMVLSSISTYIKQTVEDLNLRLEQIHSLAMARLRTYLPVLSIALLPYLCVYITQLCDLLHWILLMKVSCFSLF